MRKSVSIMMTYIAKNNADTVGMIDQLQERFENTCLKPLSCQRQVHG